VIERFTWEAMSGAYHELYRELAATTQRASVACKD
jgi:hypothetical protein